jgi:ketosteroid isomerase-like protein
LVIAGFIDAYNSGDVARLLSFYPNDLIKLKQGAPPETKEAVATRLNSVFATHRGHLTVQNEEIMVGGGIAFTQGTFEVRLEPQNGGLAQSVTRRYVELWRKEGEEWRVARAMDNSSAGT